MNCVWRGGERERETLKSSWGFGIERINLLWCKVFWITCTFPQNILLCIYLKELQKEMEISRSQRFSIHFLSKCKQRLGLWQTEARSQGLQESTLSSMCTQRPKHLSFPHCFLRLISMDLDLKLAARIEQIPFLRCWYDRHWIKLLC